MVTLYRKYVNDYGTSWQLALADTVVIDIGYEANDLGSIPQYADFCHSFL